MSFPTQVIVESRGTLLVADGSSGRIVRVDPRTGERSVVEHGLGSVWGVAYGPGGLYALTDTKVLLFRGGHSQVVARGLRGPVVLRAATSAGSMRPVGSCPSRALRIQRVGAFTDLGKTDAQRIWDGVAGRTVHGERMTLSLIELDPGVAVPEHHHVNEQMGIVVSGSLTFTVGDETRELGPGEVWCITEDVPHSVVAGPEGTVLVEVFSPIREDWAGLHPAEARPARWP